MRPIILQASEVLVSSLIDYKKKKIMVFDLDMTLTESKTPMDHETTKLLEELLHYRDVAVIGGGLYRKFQEQLIDPLKIDSDLLKRLYLFPTNATTFYRFATKEWKQVYANNLDEGEKRKIMAAFEKAFTELGYKHPEVTYGPMLEDRGSQISFSPLGQQCPPEIKRAFSLDPAKHYRQTRTDLIKILQRELPEVQVTAGGYTTIDVTEKGIDKAYGIKKISEILHHGIGEMVYVGDALFEGGNDYPAALTGVECIQVKGFQETKLLIRHIIDAIA